MKPTGTDDSKLQHLKQPLKQLFYLARRVHHFFHPAIPDELFKDWKHVQSEWQYFLRGDPHKDYIISTLRYIKRFLYIKGYIEKWNDKMESTPPTVHEGPEDWNQYDDDDDEDLDGIVPATGMKRIPSDLSEKSDWSIQLGTASPQKVKASEYDKSIRDCEAKLQKQRAEMTELQKKIEEKDEIIKKQRLSLDRLSLQSRGDAERRVTTGIENDSLKKQIEVSDASSIIMEMQLLPSKTRERDP